MLCPVLGLKLFCIQMSLSANRRQVIAGAGAAAIIAPLAANAKNGDLKAPFVEIFDARGCDVKNSQYTVSLAACESAFRVVCGCVKSCPRL
jgi:hypothetical protein